MAQDVQSMLIPDTLPSNDRYAISKIYMPHYNIGGDYIDYIKYDEDRFAILYSRYFGQGVAAALLMANFQAMVQSLIFQYKDLRPLFCAQPGRLPHYKKPTKFILFCRRLI